MSEFNADQELRKRITQARKSKDGSVLFVLGSGVSKGASAGAGAADWRGLLDLGLSECEALETKGLLKSPSTWNAVQLHRLLESKRAADLVAVASAVEQALRASNAYGRWLKNTVGALPLKNREVFDALAELRLLIATSNYDGLIETALSRQPITWRDNAMVMKFLKRTQDGVLHLHGHYNELDSVVLGVQSYNRIIGSQHAQAVQKTLFLDRTLVFIGFGAGLEDPNLGALLDWAAQVVPGTDCFHVRLALDGEVGALMSTHPLTQRIHVLGYGSDHKDLAPYLKGLIQKRSTKTPGGNPGPSGPTSGHGSRSVTIQVKITISFVRTQLNRQLRTVSDFDAFCIDHFKEVYDRFPVAMDRIARTNLLLSMVDPAEIYERLREEPLPLLLPRPEPLPLLPPRPEPRPRPQVNALLFLDRTAQYGRLLVGTPQSRKQNRVLLLHGGPEQNLEWFVKRVEEFLQDDMAEGCHVLNVPMRLNNVFAASAEDWGLHLKHVLEAQLGESSLSLAERIAQAAERSRLLLSLVAEDNPQSVLGTLSTRQRTGLRDFVTTLLPKLLVDSRRTGITVLLPLEVRTSGDAPSLLTEVQAWLAQSWHSAERSHDVLPEVRFPDWDDVASYLRSHHPPLNNLGEVLTEAEEEYAKFGKESTFEQLAKALNNIVGRFS